MNPPENSDLHLINILYRSEENRTNLKNPRAKVWSLRAAWDRDVLDTKSSNDTGRSWKLITPRSKVTTKVDQGGKRPFRGRINLEAENPEDVGGREVPDAEMLQIGVYKKPESRRPGTDVEWGQINGATLHR
ncbi:hypothetical protein J6590_035802 [Homalodisca vitripennis]|nr:hypothetical protein J6590_035802 [Homalodisca vitripennis]